MVVRIMKLPVVVLGIIQNFTIAFPELVQFMYIRLFYSF